MLLYAAVSPPEDVLAGYVITGKVKGGWTGG
jgi:hypothetical protein